MSPRDPQASSRRVSAKAFRMADPVGTLYGFPQGMSRAELYRWAVAQWPQLTPAPFRILSWAGSTSFRHEPKYVDPFRSFIASGQAFFAPLVWDQYFLPAVVSTMGPRELRVTNGTQELGRVSVDHLSPTFLALYLAEIPVRGEEDAALICYLSGVPIVVIAALRGEGAHDTLRAIRASLEAAVAEYNKGKAQDPDTFDVSFPSFYRPHPLLYRGTNAP